MEISLEILKDFNPPTSTSFNQSTQTAKSADFSKPNTGSEKKMVNYVSYHWLRSDWPTLPSYKGFAVFICNEIKDVMFL